MISGFLNYKTSLLNPALKLVVPIILLYGTYLFYQARQRYQGELRKIVNALVIAGVVGVLATAFRFIADIISVSFKWGESLGFLAFGVANAYAAWCAAGPLVAFVRRMLQAES